MVTANSASTEGEVHVDEDVEDYDYDNAGDAGDYCPGIEGQEDGLYPLEDDLKAMENDLLPWKMTSSPISNEF